MQPVLNVFKERLVLKERQVLQVLKVQQGMTVLMAQTDLPIMKPGQLLVIQEQSLNF